MSFDAMALGWGTGTVVVAVAAMSTVTAMMGLTCLLQFKRWRR